MRLEKTHSLLLLRGTTSGITYNNGRIYLSPPHTLPDLHMPSLPVFL